ncbi:MAG: hypothetical protein AAB857_00880 [Patescibacteria group bacterium]
MRKSLFVFVVLVVLAMAVPASAQAIRWGYIPQTTDGWYYLIRGDQVGMLTADNLGMVRGLTNQLRRSEIRSLSDDLMWNGAAYGINTGRGFQPMYDRNRQPLSGRQRIERGVGIVAAADGVRRIINNPRGAAGWIEAAVGAVLVNDSRYRGQPKNQRDNGVIVTPPSPGQSVRVASDGTPVAVGARPSGVRPVIEKRSGEFTLSNSTRFKMDVYDGETGKEENFQFRLSPGEKRGVDVPGDRYRGLALVPNIYGSISNEEFKISPTDAGWVFVEPDVMKGR